MLSESMRLLLKNATFIFFSNSVKMIAVLCTGAYTLNNR